jgi:hypothetical protein
VPSQSKAVEEEEQEDAEARRGRMKLQNSVQDIQGLGDIPLAGVHGIPARTTSASGLGFRV